MPTTTGRAQGVRERARAEMRTEILDAARRQLTEAGAATLSLRAVARELGMASSAVYRYFENRDALLTALIIEAYDSLGDAAQAADTAQPRTDVLGRWRQICGAVRGWALENPALYALVYGSPVPGYAAPEATIGPGTRVSRLLTDLLRDSVTRRSLASTDALPLTPQAAEGLAPLVEFMGPPMTTDHALRGLMAWTWLFGAVSFELFGQLNGVISPERRTDVFDAQVLRAAGQLGLAPEQDA
ncbi:MAG: TetR/AcrR family transcriptional regulator [Micropruina sp.]